MAKRKDKLPWAVDVMYVFQCLHMDDPPAGATPTQRTIFHWANQRGEGEKYHLRINRTDFIKTMVPKAQDLLASIEIADDAAGLRSSERKPLNDLRNMLREAVGESESASLADVLSEEKPEPPVDPFS